MSKEVPIELYRTTNNEFVKFVRYEEIERLHSIIKEVREYIKEHIRIDDEYPDYMEMLLEEYKELLEILDKENK